MTSSQSQIGDEIAEIAGRSEPGRTPQPLLDYPPYRGTLLRHPTRELQRVDPETIELTAPVFGTQDVDPLEADLTIHHSGEPLGQRIVVAGRVLDGAGLPVIGQLVEIWQANASGRYAHKKDHHAAPLDPNFSGAGRCLTGADGWYLFTTIAPGAYPWTNHQNAWRPAHIHFSLFGTNFTQRMVTQMYFPGDPLFPMDPIYQTITDPTARERLVARYDPEVTQAGWALGYRWDIVLSGPARTWTEDGG